MTRRSRRAAIAVLAIAVLIGGASAIWAVSGGPGRSAPPLRAVKGFDEAGPSTGTGDNFTAADWAIIRGDGFRLFITDPVRWSAECAGSGCSRPVGACTLDPAAVAQLTDAYRAGLDYAVYTRNVNCLPAAIAALPAVLRAHLSFAILDIEPGPGIPLTASLVRRVTALGQRPVVYSYAAGWPAVMGGSSAFRRYPLQDGEVANTSGRFPARYPPRFPSLHPLARPYGGWSGPAAVEQQQGSAAITGPAGTIAGPSDAVDLDSVNASWLARLPHHARP